MAASHLDFSELIAKCEVELRDGRTSCIRAHLAAVPVAKIPRLLRLPLASICRRAGLRFLGLKILSPLMGPQLALTGQPATDSERAEFGVLLHRVGATGLALNLFNSVDERVAPEVCLYRAYCHFGQWEFGQAIPTLSRYLDSPISEYAKLVARVNLSSALVYEARYQEALPILDRLISEVGSQRHGRLLANALEVRAHLHLERDQWHKSSTDLAAAESILSNDSTSDRLSIRKWQSVLLARGAADPTALQTFRAEALNGCAWEAVREADLQILAVSFDDQIRARLEFGTPFAAFHSHLRKFSASALDTKKFNFGRPGGVCIDMSTGEADSNVAPLEGKLLRLLQVLLSDLYRPWTIPRLFSALYPFEHFDIESSPGRVQRLLHRLRHWFKRAGLPARIVVDRGAFKVEVGGALEFMLSRPNVPNSRATSSSSVVWEPADQRVWLKLAKAFCIGEYFCPREGVRILRVSPAAFRRWAARARDMGVLMSMGIGPGTRHALVLCNFAAEDLG